MVYPTAECWPDVELPRKTNIAESVRLRQGDKFKGILTIAELSSFGPNVVSYKKLDIGKSACVAEGVRFREDTIIGDRSCVNVTDKKTGKFTVKLLPEGYRCSLNDQNICIETEL